VARLVREFHDLTAGTDLAGGAEVLCHNDLHPNNTVYRETEEGGLPYAFVDRDLAAPGRAIEDVAHVCWTWLDLGPGVPDLPATVGGSASCWPRTAPTSMRRTCSTPSWHGRTLLAGHRAGGC
jgi:aminoglycoside phosphotransferase (APT) family kinase protein